ncbi:MAG: sugar transferase, partial [Eggerthellales bacterium]|nr:sugar transferase [Eggerthellales bacterium]
MTPSYGYEDQDGVKQGKLTVTSNQGTDYDRANIPDGVDDPVAFEKKFGQGSSHIAAISADLVDHGKIVEIEQIDFDRLPKRYFYRFVKRVFDIVSSACALVLLAIPMVIIAVAIKLDSEGPVFYRQERLGLNGVPFKLIKFRSMRTDAEANGAQWAQEDDPRITKVGHFIRNTRLDEVPQFLQVITGKLSLIGPRPEREVFYN